MIPDQVMLDQIVPAPAHPSPVARGSEQDRADALVQTVGMHVFLGAAI